MPGLDETAATEASSAVSAWRRFFIDDGWRGGTDAIIDAAKEEPKSADEDEDEGEDAEWDEEEEEESARARDDDDAATVPASESLADAAAPAARVAEALERSPGRVRPMRAEEMPPQSCGNQSDRCARMSTARTNAHNRHKKQNRVSSVGRFAAQQLRRVRFFPLDLWTDGGRRPVR